MQPINICHEFRYGKIIYNQLDQYVGKSLKLYGEFSQGEAAIFEQIIKPGDIVVEAGANIGSHTIHLAQLAGPSGKVYAFEPQRLVFQILAGNIAINSLTNVYCLNQAVGEKAGTVRVPVLDPLKVNNWGGLSLLKDSPGEITGLVTLDSLELDRLKLLKADVEGMELAVLKGAAATIARCRPFLYLEENEDLEAAQKTALHDFIFAQGYRIYRHTPPLFNPDNYFHNPENVFRINQEVNGRHQLVEICSFNLLCIPAELNITVKDMEEIKKQP